MADPDAQGEPAPPPGFTGKTIYLDQSAISNIAKAKDAFWRDLHRELRLLLKRQVIACPCSPFHFEESVRSKDWGTELQAICQELAGPYRFRPQEEIALTQLRRALRSYLGEAEETLGKFFTEFCQYDAPTSTERLPCSHNEPPLLTAQRVAPTRAQDHGNFESSVATEICRYAEEILQAYAAGETTAVRLLESLGKEVVRIRTDEPHPMLVIGEFLRSENVQKVPFLDISSRLWATIAQHLYSTVKPRTLKPSDICDVQAISYYGPYCDAMFVDNEFRKLASQRNVDVPGRYGVRLFSETNRAQFKAFLDGLPLPGSGENNIVGE